MKKLTKTFFVLLFAIALTGCATEQTKPEPYRPERSERTVPEKCKNCIHHKIVQELDICDFVEYYTEWGAPVPYPYFFKQDYPCKGHQERSAGE